MTFWHAQLHDFLVRTAAADETLARVSDGLLAMLSLKSSYWMVKRDTRLKKYYLFASTPGTSSASHSLGRPRVANLLEHSHK